MAGARAGWKRMAKVYGLVEGMRAAEVRGAAWAVEEVEAALLREGRVGRRGECFADGVDRAVDATSRAYAEVLAGRLEEMKAEREKLLDDAVRAHGESRVRLDQMRCVVERAGRVAAEEEGRRAQAAADDRYAGQRWVKEADRLRRSLGG